MNAEDSGQHGRHMQVIHHQPRAQKQQQNGEVVTVMSTLDRSIKPRGFQIVRMIKCEGLCYFRGNGVFMLDLILQYWYWKDRRPKVTEMAGKMKILP